MAATSGGERCEYCCQQGESLHGDGCPALAGTPAIAEWQEGYQYGFDDNYIESWRYRFYSPSFVMGYLVGKAEIDRLVDEASQSRYFG